MQSQISLVILAQRYHQPPPPRGLCAYPYYVLVRLPTPTPVMMCFEFSYGRAGSQVPTLQLSFNHRGAYGNVMPKEPNTSLDSPPCVHGAMYRWTSQTPLRAVSELLPLKIFMKAGAFTQKRFTSSSGRMRRIGVLQSTCVHAKSQPGSSINTVIIWCLPGRRLNLWLAEFA